MPDFTDKHIAAMMRRCEEHMETGGLTRALMDMNWRDSLEETRYRLPEAGPNDWANVTDEDYGEHYDYELFDQVDRFIIFPVSRAAVSWCDRHLPCDCPRWGAGGYIIDVSMDSLKAKELLDHMERDGLHSEDDALAENERGLR